MRWTLRDLRGHFAKLPDVGEPCPHHCCNGTRPHPRHKRVQRNAVVDRAMTQAAELGAGKAVAGAVDACARKGCHHGQTWHGPKCGRCSCSRFVRTKAAGLREQLRAEMRLAARAQEQRAQRYSLGYKTERAGFYGSDKTAQADQVEKVLRVQAADREARIHAEWTREQRAGHKPMSRAEQKEYGDVLKSLGW